MFMLKKWISPFLYPLSFSLIITLAGLFLLLFSKRQRLGKALVFIGLLFLFLFSTGPVADMLVAPLESMYPAFSADTRDGGAIEFIVVLGGGHVSDPRWPVTSQIGEAALGRVVEGIRIHRALPSTKLLFSGWGGYDPVPTAEVAARVAMILGVAADSIVTVSQPRDTAEEARFIKEIVADRPFVLVTSASHMPRAMALFRKQGLQPIPAPAQPQTLESPGAKLSPGLFFPSPGNLDKSGRAVHEYLGIAWAKLRGLI